MRYLISFIAGLLLAALPEAASARHHCQQFFHHKQAVAVVAPVYYSVGDSIRTDAIVEKALQRFVQKVQAGEIQLNAAPQTLAQTAPQSILAAKCSKCHGPTDPKGGLVIDGVTPLDCTTFRRTMEMLSGEGAAPPAGMAAVIKQIQAEQKQGDVMQAMLRLPVADGGLSFKAPPIPGTAADSEPYFGPQPKEGDRSTHAQTGVISEYRSGQWVAIGKANRPSPGVAGPPIIYDQGGE